MPQSSATTESVWGPPVDGRRKRQVALFAAERALALLKIDLGAVENVIITISCLSFYAPRGTGAISAFANKAADRVQYPR